MFVPTTFLAFSKFILLLHFFLVGLHELYEWDLLSWRSLEEKKIIKKKHDFNIVIVSHGGSCIKCTISCNLSQNKLLNNYCVIVMSS